MHDEAVEPERFGAIELVGQRVDRLLAQRRIDRGKIDQIAVVRDDRTDPRLAHPAAEERDLLRWQLRARHWPADFVKICSAWQPLASARSTARGKPPRSTDARRAVASCVRVKRISFGMRRVLPLALLMLVVSAACAERVAAWGFNGHKFITDRAIDLLPQEIRPFFLKSRTTLVEHCIDPDTYRTIGFLDEPPRHFLDMDAYGPFPFKELPHDYSEAVAKPART